MVAFFLVLGNCEIWELCIVLNESGLFYNSFVMAKIENLYLIWYLMYYPETQWKFALVISAAGSTLSAGNVSASSEEDRFLRGLRLLLFPQESTALRSNHFKCGVVFPLIAPYQRSVFPERFRPLL